MQKIQQILRDLKTLEGPFLEFDMENVPECPSDLFIDWIGTAIDKGEHEPHAMTLSTIEENGSPDARILILKNVDKQGWYFATSSESKKGKQISLNSNVSLTFYWSLIGRQVRIIGKAIRMGNEYSSADFLARGKAARAAALIGKQSSILTDQIELEKALKNTIDLIEKDSQIVYPNWVLYVVKANRVEFWQGDSDRKHSRLHYRLEDNKWKRELLWP